MIDIAKKISQRFFAVLCLAAIPLSSAHALQCADVDSSGAVFITTQQPPSCNAFVMISATDFDALRNPFTTSPDFSVVKFAWGASVVMWAIGFGIGLIVQLVKRAR